MFRLLKLASYVLFGYAVYELIQGLIEGQEHSPGDQPPAPRRQPLRSNQPGRGVISR
jgi:hypothetical protein